VSATVLAILTPGSVFVDSLAAAAAAAAGSANGGGGADNGGSAAPVPVGLVLDATSFYAESGGQVRALLTHYMLNSVPCEEKM